MAFPLILKPTVVLVVSNFLLFLPQLAKKMQNIVAWKMPQKFFYSFFTTFFPKVSENPPFRWCYQGLQMASLVKKICWKGREITSQGCSCVKLPAFFGMYWLKRSFNSICLFFLVSDENCTTFIQKFYFSVFWEKAHSTTWKKVQFPMYVTSLCSLLSKNWYYTVCLWTLLISFTSRPYSVFFSFDEWSIQRYWQGQNLFEIIFFWKMILFPWRVITLNGESI